MSLLKYEGLVGKIKDARPEDVAELKREKVAVVSALQASAARGGHDSQRKLKVKLDEINGCK